MKILLVDDYRPLADALALNLGHAGHTVVLAHDGVEGVQAFMCCEIGRMGPFDAVISDWNMPRMTGPEMVREILRVNPNVKVVMMSGDPWNKPPEGITLLEKGALSIKDVLVALNA